MIKLILLIALIIVSMRFGIYIAFGHMYLKDKITEKEFDEYTSWDYFVKLLKESFNIIKGE